MYGYYYWPLTEQSSPYQSCCCYPHQLVRFCHFFIWGQNSVVLMSVPRIHKGEEKVVCCFGGFFVCVVWWIFVCCGFFFVLLCLCGALSTATWVMWSLPLCCFKMISGFHGNCGTWSSKFQSNFQALLSEPVTNCKCERNLLAILHSCKNMHGSSVEAALPFEGLRAEALSLPLPTYRQRAWPQPRTGALGEEFSLPAASSSCSFWGGAASSSCSCRESVTYRNILSFPRLLWATVVMTPLYWDEGWLMLSIHVQNFHWKPLGVQLSRG